MIRVALKIDYQDINQAINNKLNQLSNDFKIMDYQETDFYDVYIMEIKNINEIKNLHKIKQFDFHQVVILIGPEDLELIKKGYDLEALSYIRTNKFITDIDGMINKLDEVVKKRFKMYCIKNGMMTSKVRVSSINYVESFKHYIHIHAISGEYVERKNISQFVQQMANEDFIQIHKSYVVNCQAINRIATNCVELLDGSMLPIGNNFKKQLIELFNE